MRFMTIVQSPENAGPPPMALMEAIGKLGEEAGRAGVLVEMGGLMPTALGARLRLTKGKIKVTDGPFTEAKEVFGGFAVYQVKSKDEAVQWANKFLDLHRVHWPGWEGEVELRQMYEAPPQ
jgi:hypothetical protein